MINSETKSILAKLLATEDIAVQYSPGDVTASFDLKERVLRLPVWKDISNDLQDMLLGHETGHALDTPIEGYKEAYEKITENIYNKDNLPKPIMDILRGNVARFLNVIEDVRIDKRQKRRYPGLRKNYCAGYKELLDRDFFGLKSMKEDINSLSLIDRLNVYFKGGNINLKIEFSPEELPFLDRANKLETFPEVVTLTEDVYRYAKEKAEEQKQFTKITVLSFGEGEDGDPLDIYFGEEEGDDTGIKKYLSGAPRSITNEKYEDALKKHVDSNSDAYVYVNFPDIDLKKFVYNYKEVMSDWKESITEADEKSKIYHNQYRLFDSKSLNNFKKSFMSWKNKEKNIISFMAQEFEQKKAAADYSRIKTAKTGVIDVNKLHTYKFNEDIFKRVTTIPKGKNHGFIMFLDWSGSMQINLLNTLKQLFSLCLFCKKIQVPFEVYIFHDTMVKSNGSLWSYNKPNSLELGHVTLRNILSSKMNINEFNFASSVLWGFGKGNYLAKGHNPIDSLGGTPLNEAVILAPKLVEEFAKTNKLEIVNTIFLTDGDGNSISGRLKNSKENYDYSRKSCYDSDKKRFRYFYNCRKTGKTYEIDIGSWGTKVTTPLLNILKDSIECNLIGFYLYPYDFKSLEDRILYGRTYDRNMFEKSWKKNKFVQVKTEGYDDYFVISVSRLGISELDEDSVLGSLGKGPNRKVEAFSKFMSGKNINRVLLRRFIDEVSKHNKR